MEQNKKISVSVLRNKQLRYIYLYIFIDRKKILHTHTPTNIKYAHVHTQSSIKWNQSSIPSLDARVGALPHFYQ